jgi:hypothetical protein
MITITLKKIRDLNPCVDGWRKVLAANGGASADMTAELPLSSVLDSNGMDDTLWCLQCLPEHGRVWRSFAVWCARQVEHLMIDDRSVSALNIAERHAAGEATDEELSAARGAARAAAWAAVDSAAWGAAEDAARAAAWAAVDSAAWAAVDSAAWDAAESAARDAARAAARDEQVKFFRRILDSNNPFDEISAALKEMCGQKTSAAINEVAK